MVKKILILGAAGKIARLLTADILAQTDYHLVLYGRQLSICLALPASERVEIIDGNFNDGIRLEQAMASQVDLVYLNSMTSSSDTESIVRAMGQVGLKRIIGAAMLGIEGEIAPALDRFTREHLPSTYMHAEEDAAAAIKNSGLDYTLLRLTWLYDGDDGQDHQYELIPTGQLFADAQVTRAAVAQAVLDIIRDPDQKKYQQATFGVGEPGTHYPKPTFM